MTGSVLGKRRAMVTVPAKLLFDPELEELADAGVAVMIRFDAETRDWGRFTDRMQAMCQRGLNTHPAKGDHRLSNETCGFG
jgi:hypothetical protein